MGGAGRGSVGELISFSLPLFGSSLIYIIMCYTDTLMLGYFTRAEDVGLYNIALRLSRFILLFPTAITFIYLPIASEQFSKGFSENVREVYVSVVKWTFTLSIPIFLTLLLFPKTVIGVVFGWEYLEGWSTLCILSVGFFISVLIGPSGFTLVALGKTKLVALNNIVAFILNITLNAFLIPAFGIEGAALATSLTSMLINSLALVQIYKLAAIHPFSLHVIKPLMLTSTATIVLCLIIKVHFHNLALLFLTVALSMSIYILSVPLTRSLREEDKIILNSLRRIGDELSRMRR
jgi:O-antigen/teichoic acid export membrane protein